MILTARLLAGIVGLLHIWIFIMEAILWMRPSIHRRFGVKGSDEAAAVKSIFLNQGFYNLFLAMGALFGALFFDTLHGAPSVLIFACLSVSGAGLVLLFSKPSMWRSALIQAGPAMVACAFALAAQ